MEGLADAPIPFATEPDDNKGAFMSAAAAAVVVAGVMVVDYKQER